MSKSVKVWLSLLLIILAAYTLFEMIRISRKISEKDTSQELSSADALKERSKKAEPVELAQIQPAGRIGNNSASR